MASDISTTKSEDMSAAVGTVITAVKSGDVTPPLDKASPEKLDDSISPISPRSPLEPLSLNVDHEGFDALSIGQGFSQAELNFGETAGSLTPRYKAYTKLEVLNARGINSIVLAFNICVAISIVFSIISIILSRTTFSKTYNIPGLPSNLRVFEPERWFVNLESALSFTLFGYSVILFFSYIGILLWNEQRVSNEQIWVALLLFSIMLYENPYEATLRARGGDNGFAVTAVGRWVTIGFECLRMTTFSFVSLLYVWFCAHSYRCLAKRVTWRDCKFYLPKLFLVLIYDVYKLIFMFLFGIAFSELPFASLFGCLHLYGTLNSWPGWGIGSVVALTVYECILCGLILYDIFRTIQVHATADYMTHRTKQVGFRFFLHQHVVFYTAFVIIYGIVLFGFPAGVQVLLFLAGGGGAVVKTGAEASYFDTQYAPFGLHLVVLAYATIEAYTGIPATVKFSSWRRRYKRLGAQAESGKGGLRKHPGSTGSVSPRSSLESEPISYRRNEPGGESVSSKPNCFTMATHIKLFNLSWYIYYYGTPKEQKLSADLSRHNMTVVKCISSEFTDTRVLVLEASDRICISFKGTSSSTNISTDVKLVQIALKHVLPTDLPLDKTPNAAEIARSADPAHPNSVEGEIAALRKTLRFRRARVHIGFAKAYSSVSHELLRTIRDLLAVQARPVLFCGHSLGGALATLCSADVVLQPWWGRLRGGESALVSTFGSPRVGNGAFRAIYDDLGIAHWRVVAGGDVIARLPSVGYAHVGRQVALSARGDLFVDPDALEARLWHRPTASIAHHRKARYLLALRGWCQKHHGAAHGFWDFPISKADSRRFHGALSRRGLAATGSIVPVDPDEKARIRAARLRVWADAVELLEPRSVQPGVKMAPIEMWMRLTKPILVDLRAHANALEDDGGPMSIALQGVIEE